MKQNWEIWSQKVCYFFARYKTGKEELKMKLIEAKKYTLIGSLSFEAKKLEAKRSEKPIFCFQKQIACETD